MKESGEESGRMSEDGRLVMMRQLGASLFFGMSSIFIVMVNKFVLTVFKFPSYQFLGLGQIMAIILVVGAGRCLGMVQFPGPSYLQFRKVWPLPLFYILNLVFGLGSTKKLNLPMFTVLRRFALLFTSIGQMIVLNHYESLYINTTILLMVGGALVAAINDLAFDLTGYAFIFINDISTAASVVYGKQKLNTEMSKVELLFYNALMSLPPALLVSYFTGDLAAAYQYEGWHNLTFLSAFLLSCIMGFILMYSTALVNQLTSPLTLSVVGCIKNVLVTYSGMFFGGDYIFSVPNFVGINISVVASLAYSYLKFKENMNSPKKINEETSSPKKILVNI